MTQTPFSRRFGTQQHKPIEDDFPQNTRVALSFLLATLSEKRYVQSEEAILKEVYRTGRIAGHYNDLDYRIPFVEKVQSALLKFEWERVYILCERIYDQVLRPDGYLEVDEWIETTSLVDIRDFFSKELNFILGEDNLAYCLVNGSFERRGRAQTQASIRRADMVLSNSILSNSKTHFVKAQKFFNQRPHADVENSVKEALCALEACIESLTGRSTSINFDKEVKRLQGNNPKQIPPPIAEGIIRLHAYRGSGQGVAHAASNGNKVTIMEAELVLSLTASYITYLFDLLYDVETEIPF